MWWKFFGQIGQFFEKGVNLVASFGKMTICSRNVNIFYVCFTGKSKNLAEMPILKDIFIFLANGHHFHKCSCLVEILTFLKEVCSVFEMC